MNILFFTPGNIAAPMQEYELEIMQNHINKGDQIYAIKCGGELPSCWVNPTNNRIQCMYCKSKLSNGYALLSKKIIQLNMFNLNEKQIDTVAKFEIKARSIDALKKLYIDDFDLGWSLLSTLITQERNPYPVISDYIPLLTSWAKTSLIAYYSMLNHLQTKKFDLVYIYNGRIKDTRGILRAAQMTKTPLYTYNAGGVSNTYALFPDTFVHDLRRTERVIQDLWDAEPSLKIKEDIAIQFYENRLKGKVTIGPAFMSNMKEGLLPDNFNKKKKNISYFISSEDENVAIGDFWNFPFYKDQLDALNQLKDSMNIFPETEYNFYVRIHPNLKSVHNEYTDAIKNFSHPRITIIAADSPVNSYELIKNSDKVITFCSTIAAEATFLNRPSIECGKSFFMNFGSNYLPQTHEELMQLISTENLAAKPKEGIYKYAYWWATYGVKPIHASVVNDSEAKFQNQKVKAIWWLDVLKTLKKKIL